MKYFSILLLLLIATACNKEVNEHKRMVGNWEMTEYKKNGVVIEGANTFINTSIDIWKPYAYTFQLYAWRNKNPCNKISPIKISASEDEISFSEGDFCDTLNKIDPYFYETPDSTLSGNYYSGTWDLEYRGKRMFIITNENQTKEATIRIVFEKKK